MKNLSIKSQPITDYNIMNLCLSRIIIQSVLKLIWIFLLRVGAIHVHFAIVGMRFFLFIRVIFVDDVSEADQWLKSGFQTGE